MLLGQVYYYDDILETASRLQRQYSDMVTVSSIGLSHENRQILMIHIGKGNKNIILTAGVHARETINPVVLLKMIEHFLQDRNEIESSNIAYRNFLQDYSFYIIPLLNPDGYMIALRGYNIIRDENFRKNAKSSGISYQEWKYNAKGIDINRNFPSKLWSRKFGGDEAGSEPETKALIALFNKIPSIGYIDYHSRGKFIYYKRHTQSDDYNKRQLQIAESIGQMSGYSYDSGYEEIDPGDSGGNTVHYYSEYIGGPCITIETVEEEENFPLNALLQEQTYQQIKETPLVFLL